MMYNDNRKRKGVMKMKEGRFLLKLIDENYYETYENETIYKEAVIYTLDETIEYLDKDDFMYYACEFYEEELSKRLNRKIDFNNDDIEELFSALTYQEKIDYVLYYFDEDDEEIQYFETFDEARNELDAIYDVIQEIEDKINNNILKYSKTKKMYNKIIHIYTL